MKNFLCKNCGTLIQANSQPTTSGCPKSTFHNWTNLGDVGDKNYQCKNCGILVKANSQPTTSGCPKSTFHSWTKL